MIKINFIPRYLKSKVKNVKNYLTLFQNMFLNTNKFLKLQIVRGIGVAVVIYMIHVHGIE